MKLLTLGRPRLQDSSFKRKKPLLLLAYLALEGEQTRDHLSELFWQEGSSRQRHNNLSRMLSDLRDALPGSFSSNQSKVVSLLNTDVAEFERSLRAEQYEQAANAYTGSFFEGCLSGWGTELEEWLFDKRTQLAEEAQEAFLALAEQTFSHAPEQATRYAQHALRLAEPQVEMLERFHTLFSQQDKSLAREIRDLARGYGFILEPKVTSQLEQDRNSRRELEETLGAAKPRGEQEASTGLSPHSLPSLHKLPTRGTSFVGRDIELGDIIQKLSQPNCRLLSLVGIGGVGKSRLSLQVAYELREGGHFPDGIYYVGLDGLTTPGLIPSTVADTLGLSLTDKDAKPDQLSRYISTKNLLLILDNFEHLIEGATLLSDLLEVCPNLKLLVSSREHLRLEEEWIFPVEGLVLPERDSPFDKAQYSDAVQLFFQRAAQVQPTFELTPDNVPHILKLCHLVVGSPLALELAAAWTQMMSPKTLVEEIESNLDVLSASTRNHPDRHESLRAVFEHSWNLLNTQEKTVLRKLAVFRGGFTREAAYEVTGAPLSILASLVNKSLIRILPSERYDRHALVFQYSQEMLAQDAAETKLLKEQHFAYFLILAEKAHALLDGPEEKIWLERLEQDHDNFRTALAYALTCDTAEKALSLSGKLGSFWHIRGHYTEGREWLDKALSRPGSLPTQARALALKGVGWLAMQQGDIRVANDYSVESLAIYRSLNKPKDIASSLNNLAGIAYHFGNYDAMAKYLEEILSIYRAVGNKRDVAAALGNLGNLAFEQGDLKEAHSLCTEALQISQETGNKRHTAFALFQLGEIATKMKDYDSAHDLLRRGLVASEELDLKLNIAYAHEHLGDLAQKEDDYNQAQTNYTQSLLLYQTLGDQTGAAYILESFASLSAKQRNWRRSACLLGAAESMQQIIGASRRLSKQAEFEKTCVELTAQLSQDTPCAAKDKGRRMTLKQAIAYALEPVPI